MRILARRPLEGGGSIMFEAPEISDGPVKAGRVSDAIHELPQSLQEALGPVTEMDQLWKAGPRSKSSLGSTWRPRLAQ
ncbi:hypothetical protein ACFV3E_42045 [Streptomyces sp. NPDC059718]